MKRSIRRCGTCAAHALLVGGSRCDIPEEFLPELDLRAVLASAEIELPQDQADRLEETLSELERLAEMEQARLSWV